MNQAVNGQGEQDTLICEDEGLDRGFVMLPHRVPRATVLLGCAERVSIPADSIYCTAGLTTPTACGWRTAPYPTSSSSVSSSHARISSGGCGTAGSSATSPSR